MLKVSPSLELPAAVHPDPLFRVAEEHFFQGRIIGPCVLADRLGYVFRFDEWQGLLEAKDVPAIGLAPARGRDHGCPGGHRQQREAFESAGGMTEEVHNNA